MLSAALGGSAGGGFTFSAEARQRPSPQVPLHHRVHDKNQSIFNPTINIVIFTLQFSERKTGFNSSDIHHTSLLK
jgi:hypothetical protein